MSAPSHSLESLEPDLEGKIKSKCVESSIIQIQMDDGYTNEAGVEYEAKEVIAETELIEQRSERKEDDFPMPIASASPQKSVSSKMNKKGP